NSFAAPPYLYSFPTRRSSDLYRIFWLPPGEYYVRTDVQNSAPGRLTSTTVPQLTYYPGTTDVSRAVRVKLQPGEEVKRPGALFRSEEHTSELQSRRDLVCRLL